MKIWQKFKFGIFDVDGTLFDNMSVSASAFLEILEDYDLPADDARDIYLETNGMNLNDQIKLVFDKYKIEYDAVLLQNLNKNFFKLRDNSPKWNAAPLFPYASDFIKKLNAENVNLFISSGSNADEISIRLKKAKIDKYFDLVLGGEKIPKGPLHIAEFARKTGLTTQEFAASAFLTSDGPNDMNFAKKAGIFGIGITNTVSKEKLIEGGASAVIDDLNELIDLNF